MHNIETNAYSLAQKHLRKTKKGWTQGELAAEVGKSASLIGAMERPPEAHGRNGTEATRRKVAAALGWSYEAMLELGRLLQDGITSEVAEARALAAHEVELPPPTVAADVENLRGFRIHTLREVSKRLVWVPRESLKGFDATDIRAYEVSEENDRKTLCLVDTSDKTVEPGCVFLFEDHGRYIVCEVEESKGAWLLKAPWGDTFAAAQSQTDWLVGRVIWLQMEFRLEVR